MFPNYRLMAGGAAILATIAMVSNFRGSHSTSQQSPRSAVSNVKAPVQVPSEQNEAFASSVEPTATAAVPSSELPKTTQDVAAKTESSRAATTESSTIPSSATLVSSTFNPQICSSDERSNSASVYSGGNVGSSQIVPLLGKKAARIRSSPQFGNNVITCLLRSHTVARTGSVSGIWSEVRLGDGTSGWIATAQLKN